MMLNEKNLDYDNTNKTLEIYGLDIQYITTTGNLTSKKNSQEYTVDKPYKIKWLAREYLKNTVQWPQSKMTNDMQQLIIPRSLMTGLTAPSGHTSYTAQLTKQEVLSIAKLTGRNAIRLWYVYNY